MSRAVVLVLATLSFSFTTLPSLFVSAYVKEGFLTASEVESARKVSLEVSASAATVSDASSVDANSAVPAVDAWAKAADLGETAQGRPCCTSWGSGRIDCFIRGERSNVLHLAIENGVHSDWEDLGGIVFDEIECVSRDVGIVDVLVLGAEIRLYVNTFSAGKWSGWQNKKGQVTAVSCAVRTPTNIDCVARGTNNVGYYIGSSDGKWTGYRNVGGTLLTPVECSARDAKHVDYFTISWGTDLYQLSWVDGKWGKWQNLGGEVKGRPCVTTWDQNRIDVFTLSTRSNSVMHRAYNGKTWESWADLGGVFDFEPDCVTTGVGKLHCFAVGEGSYLYRNSLSKGAWTGWSKAFGEPLLETPSCVVSNTDEVTCTGRKINKEVTQIVHKFGDVCA